ncbi:MAG: glycosyl transferase, partial [Microcystaceae cyanobacterium]
MAQPIIYFAVTGHGFGHAVRVACVANQVQKLCPEALLILATRSPRWLLEGYIAGDFIHRSCVLDVGVIQADSLRMDREATQAKMTEIYAHQSRLVANE